MERGVLRVTVKVQNTELSKQTKQSTNVHLLAESALRNGGPPWQFLFPFSHGNRLETVTASWSHLFHTVLSSIPKVGAEPSKTMLSPLISLRSGHKS